MLIRNFVIRKSRSLTILLRDQKWINSRNKNLQYWCLLKQRHQLWYTLQSKLRSINSKFATSMDRWKICHSKLKHCGFYPVHSGRYLVFCINKWPFQWKNHKRSLHRRKHSLWGYLIDNSSRHLEFHFSPSRWHIPIDTWWF